MPYEYLISIGAIATVAFVVWLVSRAGGPPNNGGMGGVRGPNDNDAL